jgi:hypothetical protein
MGLGTPRSAALAEIRARLLDLQVVFQLDRGLRAVQGRRSPAIPPLSDEAWQAALDALEVNLERIAVFAERAGTRLVLITPVSPLAQQPEPQPCDRPPCPIEVFRKGMGLRREDPARAAELLRLARDLDRVGLRAPTAAQDAVRRTAARHPTAVLVDAERDLPKEQDIPVLANALFQDAVHFSRFGHRALAEILVPVLRSPGPDAAPAVPVEPAPGP